MEHNEATEMMAAERYLLGDLTDAQRDQFEEHFFDCPACAEHVRGGAIFKANARAVFAEQPVRADVQPGWWEWIRLRPASAWSMAALVTLLAGASVYQAVVTRGLRKEVAELRAPEFYPSIFLRSATRGAEQTIEVPPTKRFFALTLDLTPGQNFQQYLGEISAESGRIIFSVPMDRPKTPGESFNLRVPVSSFEPGQRYKLAIRGLGEGAAGNAGSEIASYYFTVRLY